MTEKSDNCLASAYSVECEGWDSHARDVVICRPFKHCVFAVAGEEVHSSRVDAYVSVCDFLDLETGDCGHFRACITAHLRAIQSDNDNWPEAEGEGVLFRRGQEEEDRRNRKIEIPLPISGFSVEVKKG